MFTTCQMSGVTCQVSHVTFQVSRVSCRLSHIHIFFSFCSVIKWAYPVQFTIRAAPGLSRPANMCGMNLSYKLKQFILLRGNKKFNRPYSCSVIVLSLLCEEPSLFHGLENCELQIMLLINRFKYWCYFTPSNIEVIKQLKITLLPNSSKD